MNVFSLYKIIKIYDSKMKETSITLVLEYAENDLLNFIQSATYPLSLTTVKKRVTSKPRKSNIFSDKINIPNDPEGNRGNTFKKYNPQSKSYFCLFFFL